jgi:PAS domain-containing protein
VAGSSEPVVIADPDGRLLVANAAFLALVGRPSLTAPSPLTRLVDLAALFDDAPAARRRLIDAAELHQPWRGELALVRSGAEAIPVGARIEPVSGAGGRLLGFVLILLDTSARHRAEAARRHLEESLQRATRGSGAGLPDDPAANAADEIITGIVSNASIAAIDIAEGAAGNSLAQLLEELDASARRATLLYQRMREAVRRG